MAVSSSQGRRAWPNGWTETQIPTKASLLMYYPALNSISQVWASYAGALAKQGIPLSCTGPVLHWSIGEAAYLPWYNVRAEAQGPVGPQRRA